MQLVEKQTWSQNNSLAFLKNFLIWNFTLAVCLLVVGFPLVILMMTIGTLFAVVLQSLLPVSGVVVVAGGISGASTFMVLIAATILTFKGINPQQVSWLSWLNGKANPLYTPVYAQCPLTCEMEIK